MLLTLIHMELESYRVLESSQKLRSICRLTEAETISPRNRRIRSRRLCGGKRVGDSVADTTTGSKRGRRYHPSAAILFHQCPFAVQNAIWSVATERRLDGRFSRHWLCCTRAHLDALAVT